MVRPISSKGCGDIADAFWDMRWTAEQVAADTAEVQTLIPG